MMRILIVGTGTGIGKTHVTCALIRAARLRGVEAVGLKPIETGIGGAGGELGDQERLAIASRSPIGSEEAFHVKRPVGPGAAEPAGPSVDLGHDASSDAATGAALGLERDHTTESLFGAKRPLGPGAANPADPSVDLGHGASTDAARGAPVGLKLGRPTESLFGAKRPLGPGAANLAGPPVDLGHGASSGAPVGSARGRAEGDAAETGTFHVKRPGEGFSDGPPAKSTGEAGASELPLSDASAETRASTAQIRRPPVTRPLYAFPDPISPHLAAARAGVRFDLGRVRRWVREHELALTFVETAGGLFSPLDAATSNFDLVNALRPAFVVLVAPDRLGVLHEVASTVGLAAARRWPVDAVILSAPDRFDASTGTNADSLASLGLALPIASFPRAAEDDPAALGAANLALDRLLDHAVGGRR